VLSAANRGFLYASLLEARQFVSLKLYSDGMELPVDYKRGSLYYYSYYTLQFLTTTARTQLLLQKLAGSSPAATQSGTHCCDGPSAAASTDKHSPSTDWPQYLS
jgi:hypothetical protein